MALILAVLRAVGVTGVLLATVTFLVRRWVLAVRWSHRASVLAAKGERAAAVAACRRLLDRLPRRACHFYFINRAVDVFVCAGAYRDALRVTRRWSKRARWWGRVRDPVSWAYVNINQAEALHNRGGDRLALARLDAVWVVIGGQPRAEMARHGLRCLRAWILVSSGALAEAREVLGKVQVAALPAYAPELYYTRAALEREAGNLALALAEAEQGLTLARRASSVRNGELLLAGILALSGQAERAHELFEQAVAREYRGQGGDGLLRFGALLAARGEREAARRAFQLVVERDPESIFAKRARAALAA